MPYNALSGFFRLLRLQLSEGFSRNQNFGVYSSLELTRRFFVGPFLFLQLAFLFNLVLTFRYFSIDVGAWWIFSPVADGWCDTTRGEGIGGHCFGDYALTEKIAGEEDPWANSITGSFNYPAGALLIFLGLGHLRDFLGDPNIGLTVFLALTLLALAIPALMVRSPVSWGSRILLVMGSLSTIPSLLVIDRGNSVGIAFGVLFLGVYALSRRVFFWAALLIVLAALIKPQYALFAILFAAQRKWMHFFWVATSIIFTQLIAFSAWPGDFPAKLGRSTRAIAGYSGNWDFDQPELPNYSIARGVLDALGWLLPDFRTELHAMVYLWAFVLLVFAVIFARHVSFLTLLVVIGTISSFAVSVSWGYYAVIALMYVFFMAETDSDSLVTTRGWPLGHAVIGLAAALTLGRIIIPVVSETTGQPFSNSTSIGFMWLLIATVFVFMEVASRKKKEKEGASA